MTDKIAYSMAADSDHWYDKISAYSGAGKSNSKKAKHRRISMFHDSNSKSHKKSYKKHKAEV